MIVYSFTICLFLINGHPFTLLIRYAYKTCANMCLCAYEYVYVCVRMSDFTESVDTFVSWRYKDVENVYRSNYMILPSITWQLLLEYHCPTDKCANDILKGNWSRIGFKLVKTYSCDIFRCILILVTNHRFGRTTILYVSILYLIIWKKQLQEIFPFVVYFPSRY
jgi:hypothetical protein